MYRIGLMMMLGVLIGLSSCSKDNKGDARDNTTSSGAVEGTPVQTIPAQPGSQPQPTETVFHYICPNDCEGSGSMAQGVCSVCGTALLHNDAYHNQPGQANQQQQLQQQLQQQAQQPTPPPAQNAAGEYHYICAAGCEGGAATGGTCPNCGGSLVHNQAYHN